MTRDFWFAPSRNPQVTDVILTPQNFLVYLFPFVIPSKISQLPEEQLTSPPSWFPVGEKSNCYHILKLTFCLKVAPQFLKNSELIYPKQLVYVTCLKQLVYVTCLIPFLSCTPDPGNSIVSDLQQLLKEAWISVKLSNEDPINYSYILDVSMGVLLVKVMTTF